MLELIKCMLPYSRCNRRHVGLWQTKLRLRCLAHFTNTFQNMYASFFTLLIET